MCGLKMSCIVYFSNFFYDAGHAADDAHDTFFNNFIISSKRRTEPRLRYLAWSRASNAPSNIELISIFVKILMLMIMLLMLLFLCACPVLEKEKKK